MSTNLILKGELLSKQSMQVLLKGHVEEKGIRDSGSKPHRIDGQKGRMPVIVPVPCVDNRRNSGGIIVSIQSRTGRAVIRVTIPCRPTHPAPVPHPSSVSARPRWKDNWVQCNYRIQCEERCGEDSWPDRLLFWTKHMAYGEPLLVMGAPFKNTSTPFLLAR